MKVIYGIGKVKSILKDVVLVIGVFDGLHLGHQKLIRKAVSKAKKLRTKAVVMTFSPHPVHVLHPEIHLPLIAPLPYRIKLLEHLGVAACVVIHFTKKFSKLSPQDFIKRYLIERIRPCEVFVGDDFRFGKNRVGTLDYFREAAQKYKFHVNAVSAVKGKNKQKKISSTDIRSMIASGQLLKAKRLLGRYVSLMGKVVRGDSRGKTLGYPTANIRPHQEVIPPLGVYAVRITIGTKKCFGMANIGQRPSFKKARSPVVLEVYIFHFRKKIYGQDVIVEFIEKIRDEKPFKTKEKLIVQLRLDEIKARKVLKI